MRRTLFAALLIVAPIVHAASITPLTLWELIDRSELIVLADVQPLGASEHDDVRTVVDDQRGAC